MLCQTALILSLLAGASTTAPLDNVSAANDPATDKAYLAAIDEQEALYGAYDESLAELFFGLGKSLQDQGKHSEAVDAFKRAMHVNRVNYGIHGLSQEPMLRSLLESYTELSSHQYIAHSYHQLINLYKKAHGETSEKLIPLQLEASAWYRKQYVDDPTRQNLEHLAESAALAESATEIASLNFGPINRQLMDPLQQQVESNYYLAEYYQSILPPQFAGRMENHSVFDANNDRSPYKNSGIEQVKRLRDESYKGGLSASQRIVTILDINNATAKERATALTQLGDWYQLFERRNQAYNTYKQAWYRLNNAGDQQTLDQLFGKPVMLPSFGRESHALSSTRLVRVKVDISPKGKAQRVTVLETYPAEDKEAARAALDQSRKSLFRSRLENGVAVATKGFEFNLFIAE